MSKQEFIDSLKITLNGRVSPSLVLENLNYYEDYINTEIRKGRGEQEIMASLGDPRLIAKTIISTNGDDSENVAEDARFRDNGYQRNEQGQNTGQSYYQTNYSDNGNGQNVKKNVRIPGWVWLVVVILIIILIFSAIFSVLSFLMPIILPVLLILFLIKLFRDWLN